MGREGLKDHWALDGRVEGSADGGHSQGAGGYRARGDQKGGRGERVLADETLPGEGEQTWLLGGY